MLRRVGGQLLRLAACQPSDRASRGRSRDPIGDHPQRDYCAAHAHTFALEVTSGAPQIYVAGDPVHQRGRPRSASPLATIQHSRRRRRKLAQCQVSNHPDEVDVTVAFAAPARETQPRVVEINVCSSAWDPDALEVDQLGDSEAVRHCFDDAGDVLVVGHVEHAADVRLGCVAAHDGAEPFGAWGRRARARSGPAGRGDEKKVWVMQAGRAEGVRSRPGAHRSTEPLGWVSPGVAVGGSASSSAAFGLRVVCSHLALGSGPARPGRSSRLSWPRARATPARRRGDSDPDRAGAARVRSRSRRDRRM